VLVILVLVVAGIVLVAFLVVLFPAVLTVILVIHALWSLWVYGLATPQPPHEQGLVTVVGVGLSSSSFCT
jgi:hypothetical protein